jgi:DNA polymerase theta
MNAEIPDVSSCLRDEDRRLQRYVTTQSQIRFGIDALSRVILEAIAIRLAQSADSLLDHFHRSLLYHSDENANIEERLHAGLGEIEAMGFVTRNEDASLEATQLGHAIVASGIDPDYGSFVHKELTRALQAFVMDGELHILYMLTPVQDFGTVVNWRIFRNAVDSLDESGLRVLSFLGIKPTTVMRL